jgi:hypothetical protein
VTLPLLFALGACSDAIGTDDSGAAGTAPAVAGNAGAATSNGGSLGMGGSAGGAASGQGPGAPAGTSAGGGSGKGAAGNNGASGGVTPLELEPLALGNLWTYALTVQQPTADCPSGSGTREVTASVEWEGRTAFELQRFCDTDAEPTYMNVTNGEIYQYLDGWYRNVAAPVQEGATWAFAPGYTLKWSSVGAVTVPAGTFTNCWRRTILEYEGGITFCPGVGQVKIELPPSLTAELSSYDLN